MEATYKTIVADGQAVRVTIQRVETKGVNGCETNLYRMTSTAAPGMVAEYYRFGNWWMGSVLIGTAKRGMKLYDEVDGKDRADVENCIVVCFQVYTHESK
jgi:hypothetical protein